MNRTIFTLVVVFTLVTSCQNNAKKNKEINTETAKSEFVLTDCEITFKGKPIPLGEPIEEWVKVFGEYDRHFGQRSYIWDSLGIGIENNHILSRDEHVPDSLRKHDEFLIFFSNLESPMGQQGELKFAKGRKSLAVILKEYEDANQTVSDTLMKRISERKNTEDHPKKYIYPLNTYNKVINLQGAPIQKGFSLEDINENRKNADNLKPFYKEKATYEKEYMLGDQGYYDQNYWDEKVLTNPKKCRYYFKVYYSNYELEFIEVVKY